MHRVPTVTYCECVTAWEVVHGDDRAVTVQLRTGSSLLTARVVKDEDRPKVETLIIHNLTAEAARRVVISDIVAATVTKAPPAGLALADLPTETDEERIVLVAGEYAELVHDGHADPVAALAIRWGLTRAKVRGIIFRAREKGFLTTATPGRAGGRLTPLGAAELRRVRELHGDTDSDASPDGGRP
ncbi:MAG: hypothetical protein KatS3mg014_2545 [Actinomycetota bacterium]|nr:MAG: hypothetical protein KatS3mg014_2460 [Actinomycetota bacterium]GIV00930.1 MAG: hypothetical protein KatS3mg014_2545 [Actinomycetota bacterium]